MATEEAGHEAKYYFYGKWYTVYTVYTYPGRSLGFWENSGNSPLD